MRMMDCITQTLSCRRNRLVLLVGLLVFLFLPLGNTGMADQLVKTYGADSSSGTSLVADIDEVTPWWNVSYHYRRHVNLTDTNSTPRVDVPMYMWVPFENNTCYKNSVRVVDSSGVEVPSQPYNFTYWEDPNYLKGATVFWYANISADSTATYWIYYSDDTSIETTSYESEVWFTRTTGSLSGKFDVNYWSFRGGWYNATMYNAAGGKISNAAHKMADGSWNWNWGTNRGSMHWNPDGLGGQVTSNTAPISLTTFVTEEGPLFINYTTQLPFGSYAKLNVSYTFYKWGWTTRIYIEYSALRSGSGRTDEWVFYPYITTHGIEVAEDATQTYYDNWAQSAKGKPAGFGWWNDNGMSHGTVRISHDSWSTNPSYPNNYDNYYYRWYDSSSYEYWDTAIPTTYAIDGTVLEERCAFAVWNGSVGRDGYMQVFNATSRFLPIIQSVGEVSSYSFRINVKDLGGGNISGVNVTLLDKDTMQKLYRSDGSPHSELTDSDGNVTFIGLVNKTYRIEAWVDSNGWLQPEVGSTGMNVTWWGERTADGPFTSVGITLDIASLDIHLEDLMGDNLATVGSETIQVRIYNASDSNPSNWKYLDYQTTDSDGDLTFARVPKCEWMLNFSYTDTDTGHMYGFTDLGKYCSYQVPESDITGDLTRDWDLPLVTLDFNVKAYDGQDVEDAYVRISKRSTGDPVDITHYNITHSTDSNGNVTFYRVLNGTWNIYLYRNDGYGQLAYNDTEYLDDVPGYQFKQMVIPLTWLRVCVVDDNDYRVTGAQLNLTANGVHVVTAYTDTTGFHNFTWIKANDTSIPWVYNVSVYKHVQNNWSIVYASFDHLYVNYIVLPAPTYSGAYTEINCTVSVVSWPHGDNRTFTVGWYNRTSTGASTYEDTPLINYDSGWLNFTIWHQGTLVGGGSWNGSGHFFVSHDGSGSISFTIAISTLFWHMYASSYPYLIRIVADSPGYDQTDIYTVTLVVTVADTTEIGITSDTQYWSDGFTADYSLYTDPFDRAGYYLTDLVYANYTVYNSTEQVISSGFLVHQGSGIYRFSNYDLNDSDVGTYEVVIWLCKRSYVNRTLSVTFTYTPVPTTLTWSIQPSSYTWGSGSPSSTLVLLNTLNSSSISSVDSVVLYWIDQETGLTVVIDTSATLTYGFSNAIVANGTWAIHAYAFRANFISSDVPSNTFSVLAAPTQIILTSSSTDTIEWGVEYAEFDFDYQLISPVTNIAGASLSDISWTGESELIDNGDGTYRLRLLAVQEAFNYTVSFSLWIANRTQATESVTVNVLIPLEVTTQDGVSQQNPVQQYYTRMFLLSVVAGDLSNQSSYVSGVVVIYNFMAAGTGGTMTENATGQYYWIEFPASVVAEPGIYEIEVSASRAGCISVQASIWVEVLATPSRAYAESQLLGGEDPPLYYGDSLYINFTWLTEIDGGLGITNPDIVTVALWKGLTQINSDIGGVIDLGGGFYEFLMDTRVLGMTADSPTAPTLYQFEITLSKFGYEDPTTVTIIVLVTQTPTEMTADSVPAVDWSEDFDMRVHLMDIVHDEYIWAGATVIFKFGPYVASFTSLGNGTFIITQNSADVFSASEVPYQVTIEYSLPSYVDGSIEVPIQVDPLAAHILVLDEPDSDYEWDEEFSIRLQVIVNETASQIPVTEITYLWVGYLDVNGSLHFTGTWYEGSIDTGRIPAGSRVLRLVANRMNYSISIVDIPIAINALEAELGAEDTGALVAIFGVNRSAEIHLDYTYSDIPLEGASIAVEWAGLTRTALWSTDHYVFQFDPSADTSLEVPGSYLLNFTASIMNYTTVELSILLTLVAETEITGGPIRVEADQTLALTFRYWDKTNNRPVGAATNVVVLYQFGDNTPVAVTPSQFDGTQYTIHIDASNIGLVRGDPYTFRILASAPGYQNWTASDTANAIQVYVDPPTISLLGFRIQRDILFLVLGMTALFGLLAAGSVLIRRWRIPYQIKQINNALKAIDANRKANVRGIKSMGAVIAELLAPGMAALDLEAPTIYAEPGTVTDDSFAEEADDLLGELDALDEIAEVDETEVSADFEAELAAEIETIAEESPESELEVITEEVPESEIEEPLEEAAEELTPEDDVEEVSEGEVDAIEVEEEISESEPDAQVTVEEPEPDTDEASEVEELEPDADRSAMPEEPDDEPEMSEGESAEMEPQEDIPSDTMQLSKKELIDELLSDTTESMPEEDLKKLSKKELQALFDSMNDAEDA